MQADSHISAWLPISDQPLNDSQRMQVPSFEGSITSSYQPRILVIGDGMKGVLDHLTQVTENPAHSGRLRVHPSSCCTCFDQSNTCTWVWQLQIHVRCWDIGFCPFIFDFQIFGLEFIHQDFKHFIFRRQSALAAWSSCCMLQNNVQKDMH